MPNIKTQRSPTKMMITITLQNLQNLSKEPHLNQTNPTKKMHITHLRRNQSPHHQNMIRFLKKCKILIWNLAVMTSNAKGLKSAEFLDKENGDIAQTEGAASRKTLSLLMIKRKRLKESTMNTMRNRINKTSKSNQRKTSKLKTSNQVIIIVIMTNKKTRKLRKNLKIRKKKSKLKL